LDEGEESPALIELFSLSPETVPWEGPHMFERALQELGAQPPDDDAKAKATPQWMSDLCPLGGLTDPEIVTALEDFVRAVPELEPF
jgi:hypothetical protein